ncbi:MAG: hypothetical protein US76_00410 [Parcubacteria group bacterium GW2011_GWA2_38_13b]|nr:MAG: hypothetical protein US76_00410 [Parcubacteria group bacterium GW2011_GWA2_38_13b]
MNIKETEPKITKKYEKEFFKCGNGGCKFNGNQEDCAKHAGEKKHFESVKSLGFKKYVPTIEEAQNAGDVVFEANKRRHILCNEYLTNEMQKDKKGNVVSIDFTCKKCGQKFTTTI